MNPVREQWLNRYIADYFTELENILEGTGQKHQPHKIYMYEKG